jgi:hypothetical protein
LDVDGVLSPTTGATPRGYRRVETATYAVTISDRHGEWLRELSTLYDLVWATSWGAKAASIYGELLALPPMEVVPLPRPTSEPAWKLPHVSQWVGERSCAWVDDELPEEALEWAAARSAPTLLLRTSGSVGLTEADVARLRTFAAP